MLIAAQRQTETRFRLLRFRRGLPYLLAQYGRVIPAEAEVGVRGVAAQGAQCFGTIVVVEQEDVTFGSFDQGQHIDVLTHVGLHSRQLGSVAPSSSKSGRPDSAARSWTRGKAVKTNSLSCEQQVATCLG